MAGEDERPQRSAAAVIGRGLVAAATGTGHGWQRLVRWNRSNGAGASGLARLVEVHALQSAGDAMITVALAGSLFF